MKLKAGDKIYKSQYGALTFVGVIERVTEKRAFTKQNSFNIEIIGSNSVRIIPQEKWGGHYFVGDEKTDNAYTINKIKNHVCNFKYANLSDEKILEIYSIIK